jgi:hypothetical protein
MLVVQGEIEQRQNRIIDSIGVDRHRNNLRIR